MKAYKSIGFHFNTDVENIEIIRKMRQLIKTFITKYPLQVILSRTWIKFIRKQKKLIIILIILAIIAINHEDEKYFFPTKSLISSKHLTSKNFHNIDGMNSKFTVL